jgi:aerobic-type carbon monoxide dehydrogenase small subunit (CoxS/CutS family)
MLMAARALLLEDPHPDEKKIARALSGNICRCTGYTKIVEAVAAAAEDTRDKR